MRQACPKAQTCLPQAGENQVILGAILSLPTADKCPA